MPPKKKSDNIVDEIVDFLRKNVNGRTLYTDETTFAIEGGRLLLTYSDQISLSNMFFSKVKYTMDMFVVGKEKITDTKTGNVIKDTYSSSLYRYSVAKRQSTGAVTGILTLVASSLMSDTAPEESIASVAWNIKLENNEFSWIEEQMLYRDQIGFDGKYRPIALRTKCRIFVDNGNTVYVHDVECFDVDPETLVRTPSETKYPRFISKERRA
ncbi:hypothetical protein Mpt1_c11050 [Candidatus Methanoplasma termitum]|uniref:Uncharacterized protein n=1 Tax=Candidatus Methanoplasma termitum TaxID=1577791 RepID=A0A0A7LF87_9ARCH|nr:hypothetical protein [Candidatus Methanoplasma termitum]AIZ56972.1 hypothetical protein Mpt1_c11050 [Candidatus Methanoplasma termitum]MCL2333286.1 hypothetical protein [Candidatus Methanoplasma sp.]